MPSLWLLVLSLHPVGIGFIHDDLKVCTWFVSGYCRPCTPVKGRLVTDQVLEENDGVGGVVIVTARQLLQNWWWSISWGVWGVGAAPLRVRRRLVTAAGGKWAIKAISRGGFRVSAWPTDSNWMARVL